MDGTRTTQQCETAANLLDDALMGLSRTQKTLSPKWLYDQRGSHLFEQITSLPEYYPTRTETAILQQHAQRLANVIPNGGVLAEFGSGASIKTRTLLDAGAHFSAYVPIDISADFLFETAQDLQRRYPQINIVPLVGDFTAPLSLPSSVAGQPTVGFFPGSTIGNLPHDLAVDLLAQARLWSGSCGFILGVDLVKNPQTLVAAYDDAQGVTAQFISNILVRLNTEVGADFNLAGFDYRATWDADIARINMALVSNHAQSVTLAGHEITFADGEEIHVSAARKFTPASLGALAGQAGWAVDDMLTDPTEKYAVALLRPQS